MSQYIINYACGHGTFVKNIGGKVSDRQRQVDWAGRNMVCKDCYIAQQKELDSKAPKVAQVYLAECWSKDTAAILVIKATGQLDANKVALSDIGFAWQTGESDSIMRNLIYGGEKMFAVRCELKVTDFDSPEILKTVVNSYCDPLKELGYKIELKFDSIQLFIINQKINKSADEQDRLAAWKLANPAPKRPEIIDQFVGKNWNGKVYGNKKYGYKLYINNVETKITDADAAQIEDWIAQKDRYNVKLEEFKSSLAQKAA